MVTEPDIIRDFRTCVAEAANGQRPSPEKLAILGSVVEQFPWFTTARLLRRIASDEDDPVLLLHDIAYPPAMSLSDITLEELITQTSTDDRQSTTDLIDRFLSGGEHKIVPRDTTTDEDVAAVSAEVDFSDDVVSEELARIYLAQGLNLEAKTIYERLSLLNPEKSIYFAEIIEGIPFQDTDTNK